MNEITERAIESALVHLRIVADDIDCAGNDEDFHTASKLASIGLQVKETTKRLEGIV